MAAGLMPVSVCGQLAALLGLAGVGRSLPGWLVSPTPSSWLALAWSRPGNGAPGERGEAHSVLGPRFRTSRTLSIAPFCGQPVRRPAQVQRLLLLGVALKGVHRGREENWG